MGVPPVIIHFRLAFSINLPAIGVPLGNSQIENSWNGNTSLETNSSELMTWFLDTSNNTSQNLRSCFFLRFFSLLVLTFRAQSRHTLSLDSKTCLTN